MRKEKNSKLFKVSFIQKFSFFSFFSVYVTIKFEKLTFDFLKTQDVQSNK